MVKPSSDLGKTDSIYDISNDVSAVTKNPWEKLRFFTDARIGLGRAGVSVPTEALLAFQLAHAQAQDAVHNDWDVDAFAEHLSLNLLHDFMCTDVACHCLKLNSSMFWRQAYVFKLHSQAKNREMYVQRPDLGRRLSPYSADELGAYQLKMMVPFDLAIVIVDGLSARAIDEHALEFLNRLLPLLHGAFPHLSLAPISLVQQGRVAVGDHVGQQLKADCSLVLIGERPGLSSINSMGAYLTWSPKVGRHDAQRNCISNIRKAGLSYRQAAEKALYLFSQAHKHQLSGVHIKDRTEETITLADDTRHQLPRYFD